MASLRWQQPVSEPQTPTRPMPSSPELTFDMTSEESQADKSSLLYIMLPRMVKNRIRRMPSIRRSLSTASQMPLIDEQEPSSRRSSGEFDSGFHTPPPRYRSHVSIPLSEPVLDKDLEEEEEEAPVAEPRVTSFLGDVRSGINWKFANQGLNLLGLSAQEASSCPPGSNSNSNAPSLARQLYVHGLTYLLRGLPQELTPDERVSLWSSVPDEVLALSNPPASSQQLVTTSSADDERATTSPSMVHRALAFFIVNLCLVINFLLPYFKAFLTSAYQYERQHRVTERMFASSVSTMDVAMKRSMELGNRICQLNEGKVGLALNDLFVWWVRGVTGGIHQGVGEGLVIMGIDANEDRPASRKGKQRR